MQLTRDVHSMLADCWATVSDAGPTFNQHRANVSCLLRYGCFGCWDFRGTNLSLGIIVPYLIGLTTFLILAHGCGR